MAGNGSSAQKSERGSLHDVPLDVLLALSPIGVLAVSLAAPAGMRTSVVRAVAGLLLAVLVPGYLSLAAVFPRTSTREGEGALSTAERFGLSIGLSIAIGVLLAIVLAWSPLPFETRAVLGLVGGVALLLAVLATYRRLGVPAERRTGLSLGGALELAQGTTGGGAGLSATRTDRILNLLILVALFAVLGLGIQSVTGGSENGTTELYLLSGESAADATAAGYQNATDPASNQTLYVNIKNQEGQRMQYTLVVERSRSGSPADGSETEVDRRVLTVADDQVVTVPYNSEGVEGGRWLTVSIYQGTEAEGEPYRYLQVQLASDEG